MFRHIFTDNINGLLGAISIHLMVVIAFLAFKLGESEDIKKSQVLIEFNEEIIQPEEEPEESDILSSGEYIEGMPTLDGQTLHSIASNVASEMDDEINTERYEQQVMDELGISSLESPGAAMEKEAREVIDENAIMEEARDAVTEDNDYSADVPNLIRKDNTTVSYFLEGRWHRNIYIPTYKCQGGGTVILDIIIDQEGKVVSALIAENKSSQDPCLREEAYHSAINARFNADPNANTKQLGTITYVFLAQ